MYGPGVHGLVVRPGSASELEELNGARDTKPSLCGAS